MVAGSESSGPLWLVCSARLRPGVAFGEGSVSDSITRTSAMPSAMLWWIRASTTDPWS